MTASLFLSFAGPEGSAKSTRTRQVSDFLAGELWLDLTLYVDVPRYIREALEPSRARVTVAP